MRNGCVARLGAVRITLANAFPHGHGVESPDAESASFTGEGELKGQCCAAIVVLLAACGDDPAVPGEDDASRVVITTRVDSLAFGTSASAQAEIRTDDDRVVPDIPVQWSSSNPQVVTVSGTGTLTATFPGHAWVKATFLDVAADSFPVVVTTEDCPPIQAIEELHGYWGLLIASGATANPSTPSGTTEFYGVPLLFASGVIIALGPDTTLVGYEYNYASEDFQGGVCEIAENPHHTASLLAPRQHAGVSFPFGLVIVQDQYAFYDEPNRDYALFRYTLTNTRSTAITDLQVGATVDYDIYAPSTNVGSYDPALQAATVVAADSAAQRVTGGVALHGVEVAAYHAHRAAEGGGQIARETFHAYLTEGITEPDPTPAQDVKQVLGSAPVTLAPGETWSFWYILAAGEDRAAFASALTAARAKIATLD